MRGHKSSPLRQEGDNKPHPRCKIGGWILRFVRGPEFKTEISTMKKCLTATIIFLLLTGCHHETDKGFKKFVYRQGDRLMADEGELRFISFNIPCLHYNEDNMPFTQTNPWRFTDEFEINDALEAVRQMGGQVVRTYTLSVRKPGEDASIPRHILGPGRFNEQAFRTLDKVLEVAHQKGIRVIIPFVDNWVWWGGIKEYAAFRNKQKEDFWKDPQLIADFKKTIDYVINRTNAYTGIKYRDDKAILAWETGNELECPHQWTSEIAAYIKSLDQNHLVLDGYHTTRLRNESINDPHIDIVTTHHYSKNAGETVSQIKTNRVLAQGKKPYFVGEFGFIPTDDVKQILDAVIETKTSGALIWSLRFRNRDGGFYWHSEPYGGDLYKAFHWPGFASGQPYDEKNLVELMRAKAFEIRALPVPKIEIPTPPFLLNFTDASAISWQGSAGAQSYVLERAPNKKGPWEQAATHISDAAVPYRPLFNDTTVKPGKSYYYRLRAQNWAGLSPPSNIVGPVEVNYMTLVDEMQNWDLSLTHEGALSLEINQARKFKEDFHRVKGKQTSYIIYKVSDPLISWKVFSFFPAEISDFIFSVSVDGHNFIPASATRISYFAGAGEYGYFQPVLYQGECTLPHAEFLKIEFTTEAHISRTEINYGLSNPPNQPSHRPD
jgi:mannan endo-1,4-beta-mannosidase